MFAPTQQLRVIINGLTIYTTAQKVRNGIGDVVTPNCACQQCLQELERLQDSDVKPLGIAGRWEDCNVQIDLTTYQ